MSDRYPCSTCEHYRPDGHWGKYAQCFHPSGLFYNIRTLEQARRANWFACGCGNGRRHSGYVSVWRRVWRWVTGVKPFPPVNADRSYFATVENAQSMHNFENEPHEAGLWIQK